MVRWGMQLRFISEIDRYNNGLQCAHTLSAYNISLLSDYKQPRVRAFSANSRRGSKRLLVFTV